MPSHPFFMSSNTFSKGVGQELLGKVLKAYTNCNPEIGYCQGMGYLAAILLIVAGGDDYQAYSVFQTLLENKGFNKIFE